MPDDNARMLPDKGVVSDLDARIALKEGVDTVANVVKATMGPKGRNVVYKPRLGSPRVTNDGVTVARDIKIENTFLHTGAAIVYEACMMTNNVAGDGTTTAAVLTQAMNDLAFRAIVGGANPMIVRRGMVPALAAAEAALQAQAVTVGTRQDIAWIAGLSANDREVGELIGEVFERQGPEGAVTVTDGQSLEVEVRYVDGARIETGLLSPHFANDETGNEAEFKDCDVLLTDRKVTRLREFLPFLERYVESGRKRLFFLGREIGGDVLSAIIANHQRGILSAICLKSPTPLQHRLRWLAEDLAIATGATLVGAETGDAWRDVPLDVLGRADRVRSNRRETFLVGGHGDPDAIGERIEHIWLAHGRAKNNYDREKLQERANSMSGSFAEIIVGAATEVERFELRHRIEDAISASRAGLEEGVVSGGGTALARASLDVNIPDDAPEDEKVGWRVVRDALRMPAEVIAANAGHEGDVIVDEILHRDGGVGFNAATGEFEDLLDAGVFDPIKVTRSALRNAGSAAMMLVTSEAIIGDLPSFWRWESHYRPRLYRKHGFIIDN